MTESTLSLFWQVVGWIFALNGEAFRVASSQMPRGLYLALVIVLLAGLSQGIGQSIILFINQVKPLRFALSLGINAVLFVGGFLALVLSTWLITLVPWFVHVSLLQLVVVLGLAYAPLLFSFLGALPHLGYPILNGLSIWHLLALVVGFDAITQVGVPTAFGYVFFGWLMLQIFQQTIGRPIANLSRHIANLAAGVNLVTDRRELTQSINSNLEDVATSWKNEFKERINQVYRDPDQLLTADLGRLTSQGAASSASPGAIAPAEANAPVSQARNLSSREWGKSLQTILSLLALVILTIVVLILLRPLREWLFGWYDSLPRLFRLAFNLVWIGIVALVVAGLLAPLETLGWWAGWYDDEIDTTLNAGELARPISASQTIKRYIVYLDGIGKSTHEYLPDIEEFLDTLAPTLPKDMALLRGIMPYSVINNPLDQDRPLAFLWKIADQARFANPASLLGLLVNIRNVLIVGVSADKRYGPIYNQGIAQVVYNGLLKNGYQPGSGVPVTFIGYSGGGQMSCAAAPYLKRAINAPISVISLGGVISANNDILKLEHLYHLVGDKDSVEAIGPIMFPGRWKVFPLSYWNRAKRRGMITLVSMGPVGHQVPGGILCPKTILANGQSALQQTIQRIDQILGGEVLETAQIRVVKPSHYGLYRQEVPFVDPSFYPVKQTLDPQWYQPIGAWMGRLILPKLEERHQINGCLCEIHHAPGGYAAWVGQVVKLQWAEVPRLKDWVAAVTKDVHFSADAIYTSQYGGLIHPDRLNHWSEVDPLESLAGALPDDDLTVVLEDPEVVEGGEGEKILRLSRQPMEITGRFYGLVQFLGPVGGTDRYRVRHFDRTTRQFNGPEEVVAVPPVRIAEDYGSYPSSNRDLEKSPCNETGWYIYGAQDASGTFVVQAWAPRALLRLQPDRVIFGGAKTGYRYIRKEAWKDVAAQKGRISSVLCTARDNGRPEAIQDAIAQWQEGDRALVLHTYGGIGGAKAEPAAATPIFFGHFAYGVAQVVRDPLADELRFEIRYYQVYTHNTDGLIAGTLHWSRYVGDRQLGWLGNRPLCDLVVKLDAFTGTYDFDGRVRSVLGLMESYLQVMTARYRIGDGTGGTYVGPANNCSQDSNQALFASIQQLIQDVQANEAWFREWAKRSPDQAQRFGQLWEFGRELKQALQPLGKPRPDWQKNDFNLGSTLEDEPFRNLMMGLGSWRTLLPRKASDTVVRVFLKYGASVWVLRTSQVGGSDPDIEPIAPMTL